MALVNSLGGVNLTAIAQETAKTLLPMLEGLELFTLNLSNDIREAGDAVVTRVMTRVTAQDLSSGYSTAVQNTTTTAITVTLNQFKGTPLGFTDLEVSKSSIDLPRMVYEPLANSFAYDVYSYVFGLIVNASFSQKITVAAASFDSDALSDLSTVLNKAFVPNASRGFWGNSDVFNALRKDSSFKAAYASGTTQTIQGGIVSRGMGFNMIETAWLPDNSENLIGFGSAPQAIAFAARRIADPNNWYGAVENITVAGIPCQFRLWYDGNAGVTYLCMGALYGASKGVAGNLCRVVST